MITDRVVLVGTRLAAQAIVRALVSALLVSSILADVRAAAPALTVELVDDSPIGVRVYLAPTLACVDLGAPIAEAVVTKAKPLLVNSDATAFCVAQTTWPQTSSGYGAPVVFHHPAGSPAVRVHVRGKMINQAVPYPTLAYPPFVVTLAGNERVGLHVAPLRNKVCDLATNLRLFSGVLEPNKPITIETDVDCVCYEQTSAPFVDVAWSPPRTHCRRRACTGSLTKNCPPHPTAPFELAIPSRLP